VKKEAPLLVHVLPELAARMEVALRARGENLVAEQVAGLRITEVCRCGQPYCDSFHTSRWPMRRWFLRGRQIELRDDGPGEVTVDVVRGEIAYVEVLHLDDARDAVALLAESGRE
jgi:CDGSH-type Zn-finger protein